MAEITFASRKHHFGDAFEAVDYYFDQGWTDGLPIIPPTEDRVAAFLAAAGLKPDQIVAENRTRRRIVPAEKVAINAVMAGCKPEYMPVVVAALEALCDDRYNLHGPTASLMGAAPLLLVSGPLAQQLGFNGGYNALGQGWRANATVGRTVRLMLLNIFGALPGILDKSTFGHPGKYSYCVAENPNLGNWLPFHVEQGFAPEDSTVTIFPGMAPQQVSWGEDEVAEHILTVVGRGIARWQSASTGYWVVLISPEHHAHLERAGLSKADVRRRLFEHARRTTADLKRAGLVLGEITSEDEEKERRPFAEPDHLLLLVAGGGAGQFTVYIPQWASSLYSKPVTKKIRLPG